MIFPPRIGLGAASQTQAKGKRLPSLDMLRGVVMVIMTLEHVRASLAWQGTKLWQSASPFGPTDSTYSFPNVEPVFFWIRWVANFCAPIFIFLAGMGVYLWRSRRGPEHSLPKYLIVRGFFLICLNFLIKTSGNPFGSSGYFDLDVLWPIGTSMILLGFTVMLPRRLLWCIGLTVVFCHNALDGIVITSSPWAELWKLAFIPTQIHLPWGAEIYIRYPFFPWYGVILLGYLCGGILQLKEGKNLCLCCIGGACLVLFFVLRITGIYGEPREWVIYSEIWKTIASFLNATKYPPSLSFLLMTIGPMFIVMTLIDKYNIKSNILLNIGSVPLMFYVAHYIITRVTGFIVYHYNWYFSDFIRSICFTVPFVFLYAVFIVLILYPFCIYWKSIRQRMKI